MDAKAAHWSTTASVSRRLLALLVRQRFFILGLLIAPSLLACWHSLVATFGLGGQVSVALILATTTGLLLGGHSRITSGIAKWMRCSCYLTGLGAAVVLGVWALGAPGLSQQLLRVLPHLELATLESSGWVIMGTVALGLVLPGCFLLGQIVVCLGCRQNWTRLRRFLCGGSGGLLLTVLGGAPLLGVSGTVLVALSCVALLLIAYVGGLGKLVGSSAQRVSGLHARNMFASGEGLTSSLRSSLPLRCLLSFALGASCVALFRLACELLPVAAYIVFSVVGLALLSVIAGARLAGRSVRAVGIGTSMRLAGSSNVRTPRDWWTVALLAVGWSAVCVVGYPWIVQTVLAANAHIASVALIMAIRVLLLGAAIAPVTLAIGWLAGCDHAAGRSRNPRGFICVLTAFGLGLMVGVPLVTRLTPGWVIAATGYVVVLLTTAAALYHRSGWSGRQALGWAMSVPVLMCPWWLDRAAPNRSARLLFSTHVFQAKLRGDRAESIPFLDESRLLSESHGEFGSLTLWKQRGVQLQVREAGGPLGVVSGDTRVCPQFSAELLPTLFPLSLHEDPRDLLILGLGSGTDVITASAFPLRRIDCLERDASLIRLVRERIWRPNALRPDADDRLTMVCTDPVLALSASRRQYDVIVSTPRQSALVHALPEYTREFFAKVATRLRGGGVFCQRFQQVDYGSAPLMTLVATLRSVFRHTLAIEVAGGEILLLGCDDSRGLIRTGLLRRLRRPHVTQVLETVGWDWATLLELPAYSDGGLQALVQAGAWEPKVNTVGNGAFAYRLPQEMMRWAPKWQELRRDLTPHRSSILASIDRTDRLKTEASHRLQELRAQRNLMMVYTDEPWAYRRKLREQIQSNPRAGIQQVSSHDDDASKLHPIDRRRVQYFVTLSRAVKTRRVEVIRRLAGFASPYDPLLSYFSHHEVAELYARSEPRDYAAELMHRLHDIHYADPVDRSVRNVAAAITLLVQHPQVNADPLQRWDHINALLQIMERRWQLRAAEKPDSARIALQDVELSMAAIAVGFDGMQSLSEAVGVSQRDWSLRRNHLERRLMRPLRTYRARLMPHFQKSLQSEAQAAQDATAVPESELR